MGACQKATSAYLRHNRSIRVDGHQNFGMRDGLGPPAQRGARDGVGVAYRSDDFLLLQGVDVLRAVVAADCYELLRLVESHDETLLVQLDIFVQFGGALPEVLDAESEGRYLRSFASI